MKQIYNILNKISTDFGCLYIISTPIGNLNDVSLRCIKTLNDVKYILCEDTRITGNLLKNLNISNKLISFHKHNSYQRIDYLLTKLTEGESIALVSDAGPPLVSDPGYKLVAAAHEHGFRLTAIPGPSAVLAGLACAGLPSDRFLFAGFIPLGGNAARRAFSEFATLPVTSIWGESPRRWGASLLLMAEVFGSRLAVVARELTKLHEELQRAPLNELADLYALKGAPRGEVVILVEGANRTKAIFDDTILINMLTEELKNKSLRDSVRTVTELSGESRRKIYQIAIELDT